jgi:hypothetical protein
MVGFSWIFMGFPYLRCFTGGCMINGWRLVYGWWGSVSGVPWWEHANGLNDPDLESMTDLECQQQHTNLVIYTISLYLPLAGVHPLLPLHSSCMSKFAGFCWFTMAHLGIPNHTWIWLFSVTKSQWWMMASGHCSIAVSCGFSMVSGDVHGLWSRASLLFRDAGLLRGGP